MVDVHTKNISHRLAQAQCLVKLPPEVLVHFNGKDFELKKGPVFQTAIIAGTMAAKKTSELIPLCHQIPLEQVQIKIQLSEINGEQIVVIGSQVRCQARTGVEMEALVATQIAALTIYDMCKALSHKIVIGECKLIHKSGGKNTFTAEELS